MGYLWEVSGDSSGGKSGGSRGSASGKRWRRVNPLGMRVLVKILKDSNQTEAGLYLPAGAKESTQESLMGEVLEVASAIDEDTDEEAYISGIPLGALVLIPRHAGVKVPWDEQLRIVETKEVLAVVNEMAVS